MERSAFIDEILKLASMFNAPISGEKFEKKMDVLYFKFQKTNLEVFSQAVNHLIETSQNFPTVGEIRTATQRFAAKQDAIVKGFCNICDNYGYVTALKTSTFNEYAFRCRCESGRLKSSYVPEWNSGCADRGFILKSEVDDL